MSGAFKQSLQTAYFMVDHGSRERTIDSNQSRRGDDSDEDDNVVHDTLVLPDFKVCDTIKLKQVRDSVLEINAAYYRILIESDADVVGAQAPHAGTGPFMVSGKPQTAHARACGMERK